MDQVKAFAKKYTKEIVLSTILFLFLNYLLYYFRFVFLGNFIDGFNFLFENPKYLFYAFPLSFDTIDILIPILAVAVINLMLIEKRNNKKTYKKGVEHGSAEWGNIQKDMAGMRDDKNTSNNLILSENVKIMLDDSEAHFMHRRNKNVLVIGGSGSGKTRSLVKPNLLQMNSNYVITDPKGTILNEIGLALKNVGNYKIKVLNTIDFSQSMKYNPLAYVKTSTDILKLVNIIIKNTEGKVGAGVNEDFWVKAERLLYSAYISLIISVFPKEEQNLLTLVDLLKFSDVPEDETQNALDYMFEILEEEEPNHFAVSQYKLYKKAQGKTTSSILISCGARLAPLNVDEVRDLLSEDELDFTSMGGEEKASDRKTALFIIIPDTDSTYNFIVAMLYSQMFNLLTTIADNKYKGSFPTAIQFYLDEFANIGLIPDFDKLVSTIRSRNMSSFIILQTKSQLETIYQKAAETIIGNCDSFVFLGGKEPSTIKYINETLGRQTINDSNMSKSTTNVSVQDSKMGRDLMTKDEIATMPRNKCIVTITGLNPFYDNKFSLEEHPNYKYHSQGEKYWFDTKQYLKLLKESKEARRKQRAEQQKKMQEESKRVLINDGGLKVYFSKAS